MGLPALQEMVRVSRHLVVVSDLRRGLIPYLGARALAATFWRNRLTRHDGPVSVQRAFTSSELHQLGRLGGDAFTVKRHGLFRLVLTVECGGAPATPVVPESGVLA